MRLRYTSMIFFLLFCVPDPWHFGTDYGSGSRCSDPYLCLRDLDQAPDPVRFFRSLVNVTHSSSSGFCFTSYKDLQRCDEKIRNRLQMVRWTSFIVIIHLPIEKAPMNASCLWNFGKECFVGNGKCVTVFVPAFPNEKEFCMTHCTIFTKAPFQPVSQSSLYVACSYT